MTELSVMKTDLRLTFEGDCELILTVPGSQKLSVQEIHQESMNKPMVAKIGRKTRKRSLDANAYLWVLLQKIAEKIGSTKEEVYIEMVKAVGRYEVIPVRDDALAFWMNAWKSKGMGWHTEVVHKTRNLEGYTTTINYYGSSVYDTKDMKRLIDFVVESCKDLEIETLTEKELDRLKSAWV